MGQSPEVYTESTVADADRRGTTPRRSVGGRLGDWALNIAAVLGATCILLVLLAAFFGVSIMMFKTGSMGPTIPAGSIAFVRDIPATEMSVGDVVTVSRGEGVLPVTHRVVAILDSDPGTGSVTFEMKGDANSAVDPSPYTADRVKLVMFSIPGVAPVIGWFGNPYVLGGLTLAATTLVVWAFWPRRRDGDDSADANPEAGATREPPRPSPLERTAPSALLSAPPTMARPAPSPRVERTAPSPVLSAPAIRRRALPIAFAPMLAIALLWTSQPTAAADESVPGDHLRMESHTAPEMSTLSPGAAATWTVGVWADAPGPGEITLRLDSTQRPPQLRPGALAVDVTACAEPWDGDHCPSGLAELLATTDIAGMAVDLELTRFPSDQRRWFHVTVTLGDDVTPAEAQSLRLGLRVHAVGLGDHVVGVPPAPTPPTAVPSPTPKPGLPNTGA